MVLAFSQRVRVLILLFWVVNYSFGNAQPKSAYRLFTAGGNAAEWGDIIRLAKKHEVICFGELHNNPIAHWLQYELVRELQPKNKLRVGMEMLEADNQGAVDSFLKGQISDSAFAATCRLWPNFNTDYKPIVDFCRLYRIPVVATNVPRIYARWVARYGLSAVDSFPKEFMAPMPIEVDYTLPAYRAMRQMMHNSGNADNFIAAQAIKDATMAWFISQTWQEDEIFIHLNGSYHSDDREGILWYLGQYKPTLRVLTITTVEQKKLDRLDPNYKNKADFILVVPSTMTKTYAP